MGNYRTLNKTRSQLTKYLAKKDWSVVGSTFGAEHKRVASPGSDLYNVLNAAFYKGMTESGVVSGSANLSLQTTINIPSARRLPENQNILVYSIPMDMVGFKIEPGSFKIVSGNSTIIDREGILLKGTTKVGDIIYNQGQVIITDTATVSALAATTSETVSWISNLYVYTLNVDCHVKDGEFNFTLNPTLTQDLMQNPDFTPYVTTVGLYNDNRELLAIAKLSRPIKKASNVDMTFRVQLDI